jgi:hypothetical protein
MIDRVVKEHPLFIDIDVGRSDLYPTIYTAWQCPHMLPHFIVPRQVFKFLQRVCCWSNWFIHLLHIILWIDQIGR